MKTIDTRLHYPIDLSVLPDNWCCDYVGAVAEFVQSGFACGAHNSNSDGIAHLRPMNITREGRIDLSDLRFVPIDYDYRRLDRGDVLFNNTNSPELIGKTAYIGADADGLAFSNHMTRIRFSPALDPRFAAMQLHYLWAMKYFLHRCVKHVNQASVSSTDIAKSVPFVVPPLSEQRRIINKVEELFSELDKGVEALTNAREQLKAYQLSVLEYAFGETRELRLLPTLLAQPMANGYSGKPVQKVTPWRVLSLSATTYGVFDPQYFKHLDEPGLERRDIWCEPDDILVQRGNTAEYVGVPAIYTGKSKEFIFPDLMIRLRANPALIMPTYLYYALSTPRIRHEMRRRARGSAGTMPKISQKILAEINIPYCRPQEQLRITRQIDAMNSYASAIESDIEAQLARADALRKSILKQTFSGRLVKQDPRDEPAIALLERIRAERAGETTKKERSTKNGKKKGA